MAKTGPRAPSMERVARILVDAEELGDVRAGQKHHIHFNTVGAYRKTYGSAPEVVELCEQYKKALQADWLLRAKEVRRKTLRHLEVTLQDAKPYQLAGIFKVVHEGILAHEVIEQGHADSGQDPEPGFDTPVEGEAGPEPDDKVIH